MICLKHAVHGIMLLRYFEQELNDMSKWLQALLTGMVDNTYAALYLLLLLVTRTARSVPSATELQNLCHFHRRKTSNLPPYLTRSMSIGRSTHHIDKNQNPDLHPTLTLVQCISQIHISAS